MAEQSEKGAFIEKLLFALLPLIIAGVGYLLNAVSQLNHQVTILEGKGLVLWSQATTSRLPILVLNWHVNDYVKT